jgi:predicted ATP-grasp superfamily ATP-dependent carboligase
MWPSIGVIRSLGWLGVPVYAIDTDRRAAPLASRYCVGSFVWDFRLEDAERSIAFLGTVAERIGGRPILLPADDHGATFVAEHSEALRAWYRTAHPNAELANALSNKQRLFELCREHGMPTPDAVFPKSREEVEQAIDNVTFPLVLKGIDTQLQERRCGVRMAIVNDRDELLARYEEMETPEDPNLMLQEYIPGGDDSVWMFNGYFDADSRCLLGFTGRKLRQYPAYTGATSLGLCTRNETVERLTIDFMKAVGYRGPLDLGCRYDRRDGAYKLLDVNPRIGATFRLFVGDNGMDVARAMHLDLTGHPVAPGSYREGRMWLDEFADLASSYRYMRNGDLTVFDWLRSFRGTRELRWLARDDPAPFAKMSRLFAKTVLQQLRSRNGSSAAVRPVTGVAKHPDRISRTRA